MTINLECTHCGWCSYITSIGNCKKCGTKDKSGWIWQNEVDGNIDPDPGDYDTRVPCDWCESTFCPICGHDFEHISSSKEERKEENEKI